MFPSGGIVQDLMTVYIMNSWEDVGGCDAWVNTWSLGAMWHDVWHCNLTKDKVFDPNAKWHYSDTINWWTYGPVGCTPRDISLKNIARIKCGLRAEEARLEAKAKAKAEAKAKAKAKAKPKMKSMNSKKRKVP